MCHKLTLFFLDEKALISLIKGEDNVPIATKPSLQIKTKDLGWRQKILQEVQFVVTIQSEAGIEFYSWDFNHNTPK